MEEIVPKAEPKRRIYDLLFSRILTYYIGIYRYLQLIMENFEKKHEEVFRRLNMENEKLRAKLKKCEYTAKKISIENKKFKKLSEHMVAKT